MPVVLATDVLVWLLVAAVAAFAGYSARRVHLAAPWARVFRSRIAVACAVVLACFVGVGLLDSLHYRPQLPQQDAAKPVAYSVQVDSALDWLLTPLRTRVEKTYSAPLATRLYQKENVEQPDGSLLREFPRLAHGGAHLKTEADRDGDVALRIALGLAAAAVLWALLVLAGRRTLARRWPEVPWGAAAAALGAILALAGPIAALAAGYHVFGTDRVGTDVLYQALKSIRTSLVIGTLTTLVLLPLGIVAGIAAGYFRGWVDDVIQYAYTTLNSIPGVLLIAASVLMVQVYVDTNPELFPTAAQRADFRLLALCAILGVLGWTGLARLLRGEALKLSELEYIQAAHAFGVSHARILARHILPNVAHIVIISLVLDFSGFVLAEAVLSYVGVGVDPSTISFGTMINAARMEMAREPMVWWALAAAFCFMFALVLAANLFADAVRDGFDPRVRA
ncbi:MAG: ABC transporter permease [Betaproteobacteria bacterium]|nr:ABC transporter permease [Betaproteobacteria bacterium]MDH4326095.1 ABC transporter permease [Betaproteobacteria bacterium]